jgi:hypothetical protein
MAVSTIADLRTLYDKAQKIDVLKTPLAMGGPNIQNSYIWDYFGASGFPVAGTIPTTTGGIQYNKSSTGAFQLSTSGVGSSYLLAGLQASAIFSPNDGASSLVQNGGTDYYLHLWDRVWANGNLAFGSTSRQSWVFPALARYTDGIGLSLWLRLISTNTYSNTTMTIEYTNTASVARTLTSNQLLSTNKVWHAPATIPIPLQLDDKGLLSVSAITLGTGSAAGTFGLMVAKYLGCFRISASSEPQGMTPLSFLSGLPSFDGNACLSFGIQVGGDFNTYNSGTMPRVSLQALVLAP